MEMSVTETSDLLPDHHQPSQLHRLPLLSTISYLHVDTTQYIIINHNYDNDNDNDNDNSSQGGT